MTDTPYRFDDGAAYETFMGVWSRMVGEQFLAWLSPAPGLAWADIGCGNGCFTLQLLESAAPASIQAIDPSEEQLRYAAGRLEGRQVRLHQGDAMALPFADESVDLAVMALVLFFVPDPARGVAEMVRVTRPRGTIAGYVWDVPGRGTPWEAVWTAMEQLDLKVMRPPSAAISGIDALQSAWQAAGLAEVTARRIAVQRRFEGFDDYWSTWMRGPSRSQIPPEREVEIREKTKAVLGCGEARGFAVDSVANAVRGRKA